MIKRTTKREQDMNTDYAKEIKGRLTAEEYLLLQALQGTAEECLRGKSTALITAETGKSAAEVRGIAPPTHGARACSGTPRHGKQWGCVLQPHMLRKPHSALLSIHHFNFSKFGIPHRGC